jgi:hypothetical protein
MGLAPQTPWRLREEGPRPAGDRACKGCGFSLAEREGSAPLKAAGPAPAQSKDRVTKLFSYVPTRGMNAMMSRITECSTCNTL